MTSVTGEIRPTVPTIARRRAALTALAALILTLAATFLFSMMAPASFPADDGYFYLVIANNIAHGYGSTFNGIVETNGYHPLWQGLLALVASAGVAKGGLIYAAYVLQFGLLVGTLLTVFTLFRGAAMPTAWAAAVAALALLGKGTLYLMETWLALLLLMLALQQLARLLDEMTTARASLRRVAWLGMALGFTILARLDLVYVAGVAWLIVAWHMLWRARPGTLGRQLAVLIAGGAINAAILGAYMALNVALFGTPMPISGMIKTHFPHPVLALTMSDALFWTVLAATALGALVLRGRAARMDGGKGFGRGLDLALVALWIGLAFDLVYNTFFSYAAEWYFVEGWALLILAVPMAIAAISGGGHHTARPWLQTAFIVLLLAATATGSFLRAATNFSIQWYLMRADKSLAWDWQKDSGRLAESVAKDLPAGTGLLTYDIPGILAYETALKIFPVDGLVSSLSYQRDIVSEGALPYFCRRGITYVLAPVAQPGVTYDRLSLKVSDAGGRQSYEIFSPLNRVSAGGWSVEDSAMTTRFTNPVVGLTDRFPQLALTRLPCPAAP